MTTTETLKLALEALEGWKEYMPAVWEQDDEKTITAIREALASQGEALASEAIEQESGIKQVIELYDSPDQPPQRQARSADTWVNATTWRGLTDEEISKIPAWIYSPDQDGMTAEEGLEVFARAIEAKLKAKNSL